jgi:hypothetical protein
VENFGDVTLRKRWLLIMNRKNTVNKMKKNNNKREREREGRKE